MNGIWITDILEKGMITDNGTYQLVNGFDVLKNGKAISSLRKSGRRTRREHFLDLAHRFLVESQTELSFVFNEESELKKRLLFFNDNNYEHNTSDPFFKIEGTDYNNWTLNTGNLVGFVKGKGGSHDYSLKVSSRFGDNFLKALIADAEGFLEVENFGGSGGQSDMEWLLLYFWKIKLKRAFRLGIPKAYRSKKEKLPTLRGNIDILDYALNGQQTAKYQCRYREHSYANPVNQLIHTAFQKVRQSALLQDAAPIRRAFETAVQGKKLPLRNLQEIQQVSNPYYHPYNEVIDLSRKLLRDEFADFEAKSNTNALFFDVSMLFEYFISKTVKRAGFYVHQKNETGDLEIPSGGQSRNGRRALYPDLVFDDDNGNTHVFDVKYKQFDFRYGVKREDLFQIHTYLGQVSNNYNVVRCGLIYPILVDDSRCSEEGMIKDCFKYQGREVVFEVHFFKVPKDNNSNYKVQFLNSKNEFIQQLLKYDPNG